MANSDCDDDGGGGAADEGYGAPEEEEEAEGGPRAVRTFTQAMRLCAARLTEPRGAQDPLPGRVPRTLRGDAGAARLPRQGPGGQGDAAEASGGRAAVRKAPDGARQPGAHGLGPTLGPAHAGAAPRSEAEEGAGAGVQLPAHRVPAHPLRDADAGHPRQELQAAQGHGQRGHPSQGEEGCPRTYPGLHPLPASAEAAWESAPTWRCHTPCRSQREGFAPYPRNRERCMRRSWRRSSRNAGCAPWRTGTGTGRGFGSLPCILNACSGDVKSTSCINLSITDAGSSAQRPRPRVLLKAPTLAEMEEMNVSEEEESPCGEVTLRRDRSFSEHDLAQLRSEVTSGLQPPGGLERARPRADSVQSWTPSAQEPGSVSIQSRHDPSSPPRSDLGSVEDRPGASEWLEFSHPVESLALTVEEVMDVRRVLVKAEMEKFLQNKELFSSLKKGKICCCCRTKFPLFSWPSTCLFCKRAVCSSCSIKVKMPSKKFAHIPVYTLGFESPPRVPTAKVTLAQRRDAFQPLQGPHWRSVEEEFPHIYTHGCILKDVCSDCTGFVADVVRSSRRSVDALNTTPRRARQTQSLYVPNTWTLDLK
ncbi:protein spire homolog 2 isoform X2 [Phocoena sinus]|uniref:protein spire homolog 2 isoform X2 n=1 Tax=Phocoena sinus TaxID=42100 RepID=UPI0013C44723|nr:protein spire homolog 2 isoform X2 [Phocoena sinus]